MGINPYLTCTGSFKPNNPLDIGNKTKLEDHLIAKGPQETGIKFSLCRLCGYS